MPAKKSEVSSATTAPAATTTTATETKMSGKEKALKLLVGVAAAALFAWAIHESYRIRLYPVKIYGRIIHEFDPWMIIP